MQFILCFPYLTSGFLAIYFPLVSPLFFSFPTSLIVSLYFISLISFLSILLISLLFLLTSSVHFRCLYFPLFLSVILPTFKKFFHSIFALVFLDYLREFRLGRRPCDNLISGEDSSEIHSHEFYRNTCVIF